MIYAAALDRVKVFHDRDNHVLDYRLPTDPGPVHAAIPRLGGPTPDFTDDGKRALCGIRVPVVLGMEFNVDDPDVCPTCAWEAYSDTPESRWGGLLAPDDQGL